MVMPKRGPRRKDMKRRALVAVCVMFALYAGASTVQAGDVCWIHRAVRDGDAVKVVFSKGLTPEGAVIHPDGSKMFINGAMVEPPGKVVEQNPHTFVILHKGDKLGLIGIDSGCTVTMVNVRGKLELKMDGGSSFGGIRQSITHLMPVEDGK